MSYFNGSFDAEIELNDKIDSKIFYSTMIDLGFTYYSNDEGTKAVFSDSELVRGIMSYEYVDWYENLTRVSNSLLVSLSDNNNSISIKSDLYKAYFFNILVDNNILSYERLFTKNGECRVNPKVDDIVLLDSLIGYIRTEVDSTFIKYYINFIITKYKENLNKDSYRNNLESHKIQGWEYYINNHDIINTNNHFLSNYSELGSSHEIMKIYLDEKIDENIFYDILMKFNISSTDIINKDRHFKLFKFYDYPIYIDNEAKCINLISHDFIFPKDRKVNCLGIMIDFLLKENVLKYDDIYTKKGELRGRILLEEAILKNAKSINFDSFSGREEHFGYMRYGYNHFYMKLILPYFFDYILGIYKDRVSKDTEAKKDAEIKEEIKTEKSRNIVKEIIMNYIPECRDKLKEIRELSQEFEYAIKNDYHKNCDDIESRLENIENRKEFNSIIDEINNLYRNAYNRKHNKSSLSYVMDVEEDIDLLEHI